MLPCVRLPITGDADCMVTGMERCRPDTRNRLHENVAATVDDCVMMEEEVLQENMSQYHLSRYDSEEILPQNPERRLSDYSMTEEDIRQSWAHSNFASTPVEASPHGETNFLVLSNTPVAASPHKQASFPPPLSDTRLQLATAPTDTNTGPTATTGDNRWQQHAVMEEVGRSVMQKACEEETEEEKGEGERGGPPKEMEARRTFVDEVRQFSCYSNDTIFSLI